jgi:hypothetical protein
VGDLSQTIKLHVATKGYDEYLKTTVRQAGRPSLLTVAS